MVFPSTPWPPFTFRFFSLIRRPMDAFAVQKKCRNSRWSRDAVLDGREPVVARITERDIEIFKLLARYRYLAVDDIQAFVGGALKSIVHRLNLLSRKPNLYGQ